MLLGTGRANGAMGIFSFQSPERIHAFGNDYKTALNVLRELVSIPREDSCFWELPNRVRIYSANAFQSPERIHAFGNRLDG